MRSFLPLLLAAALGCGGAEDGPPGGPPRAGLYTSQVAEVVIEVDYQTGAEPYTGAVFPSGDTWDLFRANLTALFAAAPRTLTFPTTLARMQALPDVSGSSFTVQAILDLAARHRDERDTATRRTFYVLFLDGYVVLDGAERRTVLGVSIGDTGVVALFKPVIASTGGLGTMVPRQVEQATLIHEIAHAAGLVNNGVPPTSAHHDTAHGAHCTNRDCVMYWLNEGSNDIVEFVTRRVLSGTTVLFGEECLADARAAATPG
jgi:hypothetical protein